MKKVILIVLDSAGVGALPDAEKFGDVGANTIGHIAQHMPLNVPNMVRMGLGHLPGLSLPRATDGIGVYGRANEQSLGKDTTTGHWEMSGIILPHPFPLYPEGFPADVMERFEQAIGTKTLGNKPASGTAILDELGEEHLRTGYPIVYTSADSVFQIACHESLYPPEKLYEICRIAREQLQGEHGVGRVIARPFVGEKAGSFVRTGNRRDFSLEPIAPTVLDVLKEQGFDTLAVGKIEDIFAMRGITSSNHAAGNPACIDAALDYLKTDFNGLLFVNLVDFDSLYGHRRDIEGYGKALEYFDRRLPEFTELMTDEDLLIITADHGCDPAHRGTDHTREYIPILCYHKKMTTLTPIGDRETYADLAATICDYLGAKASFAAASFADKLEE